MVNKRTFKKMGIMVNVNFNGETYALQMSESDFYYIKKNLPETIVELSGMGGLKFCIQIKKLCVETTSHPSLINGTKNFFKIKNENLDNLQNGISQGWKDF